MGRTNTVKTHKRLADIEDALERGDSLQSIAGWAGVSPESLSRFKNSRKDALARVLTEEDPPTEILKRAADLADAARNARRLADASATPAVRARAIAAELSVLTMLTRQLGMEDIDGARYAQAAGVLVKAFGALAKRRPDAISDILSCLREHEELHHLANTLEMMKHD